MSRREAHLADRALVERALYGERAAVDTLVERLGCVRRMLAARNAQLATPLPGGELQDVIQETLTVIWRKLRRFSGEAALETWVFRFCFLELRYQLRKRRRLAGPATIEELDGEDPSSPIPGNDPAPPLYVHIESGLRTLGAGEREIVRLKHFEDLTLEEIGERLGISPNTVKTRYYRGLLKLRQHLTSRTTRELPRTQS